MKKVLVLVIGIFLIGCKSDPKKTNDQTTDKTEQKDDQTKVDTKVTTPTYPALTDVPKQLNYIFDNGYEFADDLKLDFISLEHKGGDKYQLIYGMDSATDFDKLAKLKVSAVFYAKDPSQFKDEIYRKRKSRQVPAACKIFSLDGDNVVAQNFEIKPKDFDHVKFYFYNDQGVVNKKMLTVRKINLPK